MPRRRGSHGGEERRVPPVGAGHVTPLPVGVVGVVPAAREPPELARVAGPEAVEADLVEEVHLEVRGDGWMEGCTDEYSESRRVSS